MTPDDSQKTSKDGYIRLLSVMLSGSRFGIDADQIERIVPPNRDDLHHNTILRPPFIAPERVPPPQSVALIVKSDNGMKKVLIVDSLQDILTVPVADLRPFPPLMAREREALAYWGMVLIDDKPVTLLDLTRWSCQCS
ncbi:MAG: hypothetical protein HW380_1790 [Magnetococcales bacterium]|nr:hypothetical protein [Magnetococcales bacterium]